MNANLACNLSAAARRGPGHPALRLDDTRLDYQSLEDLAARTAALIASSGVAPGDRVGLMLPNVPEFAALYYGALWAGAIVVPMNVLFKRGEIGYTLEDSGAKLLLAWESFAEQAERSEEHTSELQSLRH